MGTHWTTDVDANWTAHTDAYWTAHTDANWTAHVDAASACLERQQRLTLAEVRAFDEFRRRVCAMEVTPENRPGDESLRSEGGGVEAIDNGVTRTLVDGRRPLPRSSAVLHAYEETVMALPHYDDVYGDSPRESITLEFGPEVASLIGERSTPTPSVARLITAAAVVARENREGYLPILDSEATSVSTARAVLLAARETYETATNRLTDWQSDGERAGLSENGTAHELADNVTAQIEECERCISNRQTTLQAHRRRVDYFGRVDEFNAYVYRSLPVTYPVLVDLLSAIDGLSTVHSELERRS